MHKQSTATGNQSHYERNSALRSDDAIPVPLRARTRCRCRYLEAQRAPNEFSPTRAVMAGVLNFITSFVLYGYLIPISLYVSMEMVKVVQSMVFISADRDMYHAASDTPAQARTSNLNEVRACF